MAGETPEMQQLMVLQDRVYVPAFIKSCAAKGLELRTQEDLRAALNVAMIVKMSQTESKSSLVQRGAAALMKEAGIVDGQTKQASVDPSIQAAFGDMYVRLASAALSAKAA